jgi:nucleotide-binding universal stress UspA family protein
MREKMKVLIAYDGSECADEALDDLKRAGLPEGLEVVVLSVADVFVPPPTKEGLDDTFPFYIPPGIRRAHEHAMREVDKARKLAERARDRLKTLFPRWEVRAEAYADSPAWAIIRKADEWKPSLVVLGSHGHTVLGGRLILGSVSQKVLYEARCSVRVARQATRAADSPARIIIGTDGSSDAAETVATVAGRDWPVGSEVKLVAVLDTVMSVTPDPEEPSVVKWVEVDDESEWDWVRQVFEPSAEKLRRAGLIASVELRKGNPKRVIVEEAEEWGADSIFLGAKGMRGIDRLLLGSVSAAAAARANCTVEIVRRPAASESTQT